MCSVIIYHLPANPDDFDESEPSELEPTRIELVTWNLQRGGFSGDKKQAIDKMLEEKHPAIMFIQEGGPPPKPTDSQRKNPRDPRDPKDYMVYSGVGVGSKTEGCTNHVIAPLESSCGGAIRHTDAIGGPDAGRTAACAVYNGALFISWHSIASDDNSDTKRLFEYIDEHPWFDLVVVGGDFNAAPERIVDMLERRRWEYDTWWHVCNTGEPTQGNPRKKEYDFFVILRTQGAEWNFSAAEIPAELRNVSDHSPVVMTLEFRPEGAMEVE